MLGGRVVRMGKRVCAAQKDPQGKPGAAGEIAVESPCAGVGGRGSRNGGRDHKDSSSVTALHC